jgi:hypothetical protein
VPADFTFFTFKMENETSVYGNSFFVGSGLAAQVPQRHESRQVACLGCLPDRSRLALRKSV